jgi:hypothetical protein
MRAAAIACGRLLELEHVAAEDELLGRANALQDGDDLGGQRLICCFRSSSGTLMGAGGLADFAGRDMGLILR